MGLLDKILGRKKSEPPSRRPEHALPVRFSYGSTDLSRLFALEERLGAAITITSVGEFVGNEVSIDGIDRILYMFGPAAEALFTVLGEPMF